MKSKQAEAADPPLATEAKTKHRAGFGPESKPARRRFRAHLTS